VQEEKSRSSEQHWRVVVRHKCSTRRYPSIAEYHASKDSCSCSGCGAPCHAQHTVAVVCQLRRVAVDWAAQRLLALRGLSRTTLPAAAVAVTRAAAAAITQSCTKPLLCVPEPRRLAGPLLPHQSVEHQLLRKIKQLVMVDCAPNCCSCRSATPHRATVAHSTASW
jgi:hypothetical protein